MTTLRNDEARELQCAQRGIGLDDSCPIQIVVDQLCKTPQDVALLGKEFSTGGINTIKVYLIFNIIFFSIFKFLFFFFILLIVSFGKIFNNFTCNFIL